MGIEDDYDISLIASLALKEKQIQQNYRPIIAVHKWFARRPGTLFRGLILSEFGDGPLSKSFFNANDFHGRMVADPFMGGGTPLIEANRVGCDVLGFDINPMAAWIVRQEISHLDRNAYLAAAEALLAELQQEIGDSYRTNCPLYGDKGVPVKYFLWVKLIDCDACGHEFDLFPGYLIADDSRHSANLLLCATCGELNPVAHLSEPGVCSACTRSLRVDGPAKRGHCACPRCGTDNVYTRPEAGPPRHRLFAIEYFNPRQHGRHKGRFFKKPDANDLEQVQTVTRRWNALKPKFVPDQEILPGDETDRLHRWGYKRYRELFNERQLLGLELSCRHIAATPDQRVRHALATNLSDLLRYQNVLCRYDTTALKSLDIFSVHGFPVGLVSCESNLIGFVNGNGVNVGSGGWTNIIEKFHRAKSYCDAPFEVRQEGRRKVTVPVPGEWIGEHKDGAKSRVVTLGCESSTTANVPPSSLDAVFTDPPYFGNVQYGELMDFCYVWLRGLVGREANGFGSASSRSPDELTGNTTQSRGIEHFTDGLSAVYTAMAQGLKPGAPLAFTFHHNRIEPYHAVAVAILDAGLTCLATLPCPAEMGGSIHIHGTASSIVDSIFVCRHTGSTRRGQAFESLDDLEHVMKVELSLLRAAGMKPTAGDIRCMLFGHLARIAIVRLRKSWDPSQPTAHKLEQVATTVKRLGDHQAYIDKLAATPAPTVPTRAKQMPLFPQEDLDVVPV
jgi:adenine-specific DNA methylase